MENNRTEDNRIKNIILYGPGNVGSRFLEVLLENSSIHNLTLKGVGDIDISYTPKKEGFSDLEIREIIELKRKKIKNSDILENGAHEIRDIKLLAEEADESYVLLDATNSDGMLDILYEAAKRGAGIVSINKKPYAADNPDSYEKIEFLLNKALDGTAKIRGTVGANLGAPDTLIRILNEQKPDSIKITGCMSGTLGYVCSNLEEGRKFSEVMKDAVENGYTEPKPWDDLSGRDVLNKSLILARLIATWFDMPYSAVDVRHEPFISSKVMPDGFNSNELADLVRMSFVEKIAALDEPLAELVKGMKNGGSILVPRYVGEIIYENESGKNESGRIKVEVGLKAVPQESEIGSLKGTNNIFLFGVNGEEQKKYFEPGPGAGIPNTALALYGPLMELVNRR